MATLYEADFYSWTQEQAAKLRQLAAERSNIDLDLENIAEEMESMAGSDRRELGNRLSILLVHLLKLAYCFYPEPRRTWENTVRAQRRSIERIFDQSPSLRRLTPEMLEKAYERALEQAATETVDLTMSELPKVNPFPLDDMLDVNYIPEPPARFDA